MDFASSHAFIGEDAYEEIQEDVLAGDLLSNLDASGSGSGSGSGLAELEAASGPARARSSFFGRRSRSRSRSPARPEQAQVQPQPQPQQAANRSPSFLSRIFGSSSSSSSSSAASAAPAPASAPAPAPVAAAPPSGAAYGASAAAPLVQPQIARKRAVFQTQADTNVAAIKFGTLAEQAHQVFAGDPIFCSAPSCGACLNAESVLLTAAQWKQQQQQEQKHAPSTSTSTSTDTSDVVMNDASSSDSKQREPSDDELVWRCEFCSHVNILDAMDDAERPTGESRDYVLVPAPTGASSSDEKNGGDASGAVIFVIDISGSMCSTSEVPGSFKLKGVKNNTADFDIPMGADERVAPQRRRNDVTYVSRLQCVSAAIDAQIESWSKQHPNKQVGLVTFNNEVTIIGDGTKPEEIVTGDKLRNDAVLREIGSKHGIQSAQPISVTAANLSKKLFSLEEKGQTALGPALLIATAMANQRVGSTVIVCTDGLANQGVGALDTARSEEEKLAVEAWYEGVGTIAKSAGTTISVITIAGAEARLEDLSIAVNLTGGTVDRVDPLQLTQNFGSILANPVIATQVSATFLLHKGLKFRNHVAPAPAPAPAPTSATQAQQPNAENKMHKEIGAVSADTEITFEYEVRDRAALTQYKDAKKLPFQVQIHYTKLNGMKCLRVISKSQSLTASRDVAERSARLDLLAANVAQSSSRMAEKGDYGQARAKNLAWGKLMKRAANVTEVAPQQQQQVYSNWLGETAVFDRSLHVQQAQLSSVNTEQEEDGSGGGSGATSAPRAERAARGMRDDRQYAEIHKFKGKSSAAYSRPPNK